MNSTSHPLLHSLAITLTSLVVMVMSYASLSSEEESRHLVLGTFPNHSITYNIKSTATPSECLGSLTIALTSGKTQAGMTMKGWLLVSLAGHGERVEFDASLVFNALGQLSASVIHTTLRDESLRIGTLGVNPLTFQIYQGTIENRPIFEQTVPGPIELRPHNDEYQIVAPHLPGLRTLEKGALPIALEPSPSTMCSTENASALDLTPLLRTALTLTEALKGIAPPL